MTCWSEKVILPIHYINKIENENVYITLVVVVYSRKKLQVTQKMAIIKPNKPFFFFQTIVIIIHILLFDKYNTHFFFV